MKNNNNNNLLQSEKVSTDFPGIDLRYAETKEEIWNRIESKIDSKKPDKIKVKFIPKSFYVISVAASIIFIVGMVTFFRFYTKTFYCPPGQHLTMQLPDKTEVKLNALSIISYHPFWMKIDRSIRLEGEAYFNVKKGSDFKVISSRGETIVLGTTFNIFSRDNEYAVSCFTGNVKVVSHSSKESIILQPDQQAYIQENGSIKVESSRIGENSLWMNNMFYFTGTPLKSVIMEIERQYNITIRTRDDYNLTYTGNFARSKSYTDVLDLICKSLDLKFEETTKHEYIIFKD